MKRLFLHYLVAMGAVGAALCLRLAFMHAGLSLPLFITFYPAVMVVALIAGMWPGIAATALTVLAVDYWLILPVHSFKVQKTDDIVSLALFFSMGVFMTLVAERSRRNRDRAAAYEKELAIRIREKRYRDLVEFSPLAILVHRATRIVFANPAACRLYGASQPDQLLGKTIFDLFHPDYHAMIRERIQLAMGETHAPLIEERIVRLDGGIREVEVVTCCLEDEAGPAIQVIIGDISKRKLAETALRQFAEQRRLALEAAELGTWDYRLDTDSVYWDEPCRDLFGVPAGEKIDYPDVISRIHSDDRIAIDEAVKRAVAGENGGVYHREFRVVWPDQSVHWVSSHGRVYFEGEGDRRRSTRFIGVNMDITARKQWEEELRRNREWLRVTLASIGDAVMASDAAGRITFLNPVAEALTGWPEKEAIGQPMQQIFRIVNEVTGAPAEDIVGQVLRQRRTFSLANHTVLVTRDGREIPIEDSAAPILTGDGDVSGVVLVFHEVTERRKAQNALRQSNAVLKSFNTILEEALNCDTQEELAQTCLREIITITESAFGFVGEIGSDGLLHDIAISHAENLEGEHGNEHRPPRDLKIHGLHGRVLLDSRSLLTNLPTEHPDYLGAPPGHPALTAFLGVPLIDGGRTVGLIAVANRPQGYRLEDQTALEALAPAVVEGLRRSRAEQELRSNEARLRMALDSANSGTWEWDLKTNRNLWSEELWPLYGLAPHSCEPSYEVWLSVIHPDDRRMAERTVQEAAASGNDLDLEFRVRHFDGTVRWLMTRGRCIRDTAQKPIRYAGIILDITERKRAESALMQSEKLASVGRVAATIAHEINNPLAAVMNTLFLARSCPDAPPLVQQYLDIADEELKRVSLITHQALGFYRESSAPAQVSVATILDSAMDLLQSRIKSKGATVAKQYQPGLQMTAVAGELRQVFSNLLANSLDAIGDYGTIKLRARAVKSPKDGCERIQITVADNGSGVDTAVRPRIFEALFTTKDAIGTGLGLWVSKQIIEKHGGAIHLRSSTRADHRGTTFSILLPLQAKKATHSAKASS